MLIELEKLILIFIRIVSFIVVCPGFSFRGFPNTFKVILSISLTAIIYTITPEMNFEGDMFYLLFLVIKETLFGLAVGYVTNLIFSAIEMAGQLLDFQVGFSMAAVFDASVGNTSSNYGRLYYWTSICLFFILDIHHKVINALIQSFQYVPLDSMEVMSNTDIEGIVTLFGHVFETAVNLAAPLIIVVLIVDIVLGVISRTIPQINVLMLGMPVKSMVSFVVFLIMLTWITNSMGRILMQIPGYLNGFIS